MNINFLKQKSKMKPNIEKDFEIQRLELEKESLLKVISEKEVEIETIKLNLTQKDENLRTFRQLLNKYYNLYDISAIINSIYDFNSLIKYINDSILNIVEVDFSSIILFDTKGRNLIIENTNIYDETEKTILTQNANNEVFSETIESGSIYIDNAVKEGDYSFIGNRGIKSFCCIPITTINKKYGIILAESTMPEKFTDEIRKLASSIGYMFAQSLENIQLYKRIAELATLDGLTGIYNRRYFQERISKELALGSDNNYPVSLIIFDIDHFKRINDTYSHQVGDKVLKEVIEIAKKKVNRNQILCRYGGEEFTIIIPKCDSETARALAEDIRKDIEAMEILDRRKVIKVTVSFGVASYPNNAKSESNLIKLADRALYNAKDSGRNCVKVSEESI